MTEREGDWLLFERGGEKQGGRINDCFKKTTKTTIRKMKAALKN